MSYFVKIGQSVEEILQIFDFSSAILDLFGANLDHPRRVVGGVHQCAKFGNSYCCSFENMEVSIFIDRVAGEIIRLVASVCVRVCPFDCGRCPVCTV